MIVKKNIRQLVLLVFLVMLMYVPGHFLQSASSSVQAKHQKPEQHNHIENVHAPSKSHAGSGAHAQTVSVAHAPTKQTIKAKVPAVPVVNTLAPASASPATQKLNPAIVDKVKEYKDKKTVIEKISCLHEMLALITPAASPLDKNAITEFCLPLFKHIGDLTKNELTALTAFFSEMVAHQFQASDSQKAVINEWIVIIGKALEVCDDKNSILVTVKNTLKSPPKDNFTRLVKTLFFGILLLDTDLAPAEMNQNSKDSLLERIRQTLPVVYTQRAGKALTDLKNIEELLTICLARPALKSVVGANWVPTIHVLVALTKLQTQKNQMAMIKEYKTIAELCDQSINRYEVSLFMQNLHNFVVNRKDRALSELEAFLAFLKEINNPKAKIKNTLNKTDENNIATWSVILSSTVALLQAQASASIHNQISFVSVVLADLAKNKSDYENTLLLQLLNTFFVKRGLYNAAALKDITRFLHKVQKTPNLLAAKQLEAIVAWIKEIDYAASITKAPLTYCEALILKAQAGKDLGLAAKVLDLFNFQQPPSIINKMVMLLNSLFTQRVQLDKTALANLLNKAMTLKIGTKEVFTLEQRSILKQWLASLS